LDISVVFFNLIITLSISAGDFGNLVDRLNKSMGTVTWSDESPLYESRHSQDFGKPWHLKSCSASICNYCLAKNLK